MTPYRTIGLCAIIWGLQFSFSGCSSEKQPANQEQIEVKKEQIPRGDAARRLLFEKRCLEGHFGLCGELGLMWERGWGGQKDKVKADEYYKKACDRGVLKACKALGRDLPPEEQMGIYDKYCEEGNGFSCNNLGHMLLGDMGVPKDEAKARACLDKACSAGYAASCFTLEKILSAGIGGSEDKERAKEIMERARTAVEADEALKAKYLGAPPRDKLPVVKPSKELLEQLKSMGRPGGNEEKKDDKESPNHSHNH
jgi:TPR repeat protein